MIHPASQALYAYWNEVRLDRVAPRRLEIQPARMGDILLDTFILERADYKGFRFRLAGTRVSTRFGINLKSNDFLACWRDGDRALLEHHLEAITDLGRVGLFTGEGRAHDDVAISFELLILPLIHTGQTIDRLLCLMVPLEEPSNARKASVHDLRLMAAEAVWPNGPPRDVHAAEDRQLPLHPHVRLARIVRQGRRQFRVYEGGLVGQAREVEPR